MKRSESEKLILFWINQPDGFDPEACVSLLRERDTYEDHLCADAMEALIDRVEYLETKYLRSV